MLIRYFRLGFPRQYIVLVAIGLMFWGRAMINPPPMPEPDGPVPLYSLTYTLLHELPHLATLLSFLLMIIASCWFNYLLNHHGLIQKNSTLGALVFMVLASISPIHLTLMPCHIALFLMVLILQNILASYDRSPNLDVIYSGAFFTAIASFFYMPFLIFFGLIIISFMVFRTGILREFTSALFGLLTPFLYLAVWYFWNDRLISESLNWYSFYSKVFVHPHYFQPCFYVAVAFTMVLVINGIFFLLRGPFEKIIAIRAKTFYFFWLVFFTLVSYPFSHELANYHIILFTPAFTLLITIPFLSYRKFFWPELVFMMYLLFILIHNLFLYTLF